MKKIILLAETIKHIHRIEVEATEDQLENLADALSERYIEDRGEAFELVREMVDSVITIIEDSEEESDGNIDYYDDYDLKEDVTNDAD